MKKELFHIYGPLSINSYGVCIIIGISLFTYLIKKHPTIKRLNLYDKIIDIAMVGTIAGIIGGRTFFMLSEPQTGSSLLDYASLWDGGFSLLGSVLAIIASLICFFKITKVPVLPCLDSIAVHAPLLQSIARVGCFFAGCCHGVPTHLAWGFTYTDPDSMAPLYTSLHLTQLYSAATLFAIFLLLYYVVQYYVSKPGQLFAIYLLFISGERFCIDFWRADRIFLPSLLPILSTQASMAPISIHQFIALLIFVSALITLLYLTIKSNGARKNTVTNTMLYSSGQQR